jgi:hypothetical protein
LAETGVSITVEEDGRNSYSDITSSLKEKYLVEEPLYAIINVAAFSHANWCFF